MNKHARFDEISSMTLKDIKETKCYGRTDGRMDNVKTVYPPTNTVCRGYNKIFSIVMSICQKNATTCFSIKSCISFLNSGQL